MGRQRTQHKVIGWLTTQQEEWGEGNKAKQSGGVQHNKRGEQTMQGNWAVRDTREEGGGGPNAVADNDIPSSRGGLENVRRVACDGLPFCL
jgi:hypothetical protein